MESLAERIQNSEFRIHSDSVSGRGADREPIVPRRQQQPMPRSRREVLKTAAGLGLSLMLPAMDVRASEKRGRERPKSLITLWLAGGPSQLETWDPHPGTAIGGPTKAIPTKIKGLQFADHYPRLAEEIDALSVIRSLVSKEGDHERATYYLKTGFRPAPALVHPSIGAILTHELPDPAVEIPRHVSLVPGPRPARGGFLGARYDAFKVYDPGNSVQNLKAHTSDDRQKRRLANLEVLSRSFRRGRWLQSTRTLHEQTIERALVMMSSEQLKAFEIDDEPQKVRDSYGDSPFGRGCLVARRLVETGVRAVEVTLTGFDSHAGNFDAHQSNGAILDPAFASLVSDLRERSLLESTVVLCIGEFGRTPNINPLDGRDHWPSGFSCVIGGGGLAGGLVIGATDPIGKKIEPEDPIDVNQLYATIFETMGVDYAQETITPIGRPMKFSDGEPIPRLLG